MIASRIMDGGFVKWDDSSARLIVRGSWVPLLVILGIFITRYLLGVARALQFQPLDQWPLQMLVAGGLGSLEWAISRAGPDGAGKHLVRSLAREG